MGKTFPGAVAQRENGKAHVRVRSLVRYPPFVVGAYLRPLPRSHCGLAYSVVQNRATTFALDCVNSRSTTGRNFDVKFTEGARGDLYRPYINAHSTHLIRYSLSDTSPESKVLTSLSEGSQSF